MKIEGKDISAVAFGVDTDFYNSDQVLTLLPSDEPFVLSVGRDRSRDFRTLLQAAEFSGVKVVVVSPSAPPIKLPLNVEWISKELDHASYRDLLQNCAAVVVPTFANNYPGGQTVLLEAMAMQRTVITTDSAAIRDYIQDGITGWLVPPRNPHALAEKMQGASNGDLDKTVSAAFALVIEKFNVAAMWAEIGNVLTRSDK